MNTTTTWYAEARNERSDRATISITGEYNALGPVPTKMAVEYGKTSPIWPITPEGVCLLINDGLVPRIVERPDKTKFFVFTIVYR